MKPLSSFPLADFISHSFSMTELRFLFQHVLPDLSGRTLVDVGSRLGAVLYGVRGQHTHTHTVAVFVTVEDIRPTVLLPDKWSCADVQVFQEHKQTLRRLV